MTVWVVGGGGLIGRAVTKRFRSSGRPVFESSSIPWGSPEAPRVLMEDAQRLVRADPTGWSVVWCAGVGVTSAPSATFEAERLALKSVLAVLEAAAAGNPFLLASSAGAVYAGGPGGVRTEESSTVPLSAYGESRLRNEMVVSRSAARSGLRVVIARLSNVYGPGQNLRKPQGLISHLVMSALRQRPLPIYVPLDTIRDYIFVDDVARHFHRAEQRIRNEAVGTSITKIIASGVPISVGGLLGEFQRRTGPRPLIVQRSAPEAGLQGRDLRLRSVRWVELNEGPGVSLAAGIDTTFTDLAMRLAAGSGDATAAAQRPVR